MTIYTNFRAFLKDIQTYQATTGCELVLNESPNELLIGYIDPATGTTWQVSTRVYFKWSRFLPDDLQSVWQGYVLSRHGRLQLAVDIATLHIPGVSYPKPPASPEPPTFWERLLAECPSSSVDRATSS